DVIISNHAEPDHSGELAATIHCIQPDVTYASAAGQKTLDLYYGIGDKITVVKEGQVVDLGGLSVGFADTKMCHWPDSMVSYCPERKILFSQDGFGMHLASAERFADEVDQGVLRYEAAKYYANILLPLSGFVQKTVQKVTDLKLDIDIICPDHGPIWRKDPMQIIQWYSQWADQKRNRKVVVLYDTMWKSTEKMAKAVVEGVIAGGAKPTLMSAQAVHRSDVATRLLESGGFIIGASTLNNEILPRMADMITYVKGLRPKGLVGGAFGSYGWSGESPTKLNAILEEMGVSIPAGPVKAKYAPSDEALQECFSLGKAVAEKLNE
ncbi:MAG TPA: flavodoxin domain-containing protein, partial [Phycisphaerae bacterium]|nr:flavodoxin domain-containing protein [Phycisphaerae bacterium]